MTTAPTLEKTATLEIRDLHASVEGKEILKGIDLTVRQGEVHALMGPNGSGKSTLANTLLASPEYQVTAGRILFKGEDVTELGQAQRVKRGLVRTFQINTLLRRLTVLENVALAIAERAGSVPVSSTPEELRSVIEQTRAEVASTIQEFGLQQDQ